ncbi:glycyl-tRNA synthetase beta chain [Desulfonatronum thiosulfatophilum]|uniref:Glycine--tRNA ligase beta subunit n=1 Tax=Desulfonatronum thiosulfatophilum TaxID=617002 RepID=A0A1G6DRC7_9BACT|nr:glycine--tRNA ligase subunit beta [Desulfonatronum thiosulfatophilum]SDB47757.1 glycyl-tRNA synthetase beta chain [Desulfonatronum thiosulfatophilum]
MNSSAFVLEIGTEEIPSRFLLSLEKQLAVNLAQALEAARIAAPEIQTASTPRRMTVFCEAMSRKQDVVEELFIGPPWKAAFDAEGRPQKPGLGFAAGHGADVSELFAHETPKGAYAALRKQVGGGAAVDILPGILSELVSGLAFPKKMRWANGDATFGRPIRWILCLLGPDTVDVRFAGVSSDRITHGHRVLGPGPWNVPDAGEYFQVLTEQGHVVLQSLARRETIVSQADGLAGARQARIVWKQGLLDEVVQLVEHPVAVLGGFDPSYLELPREVLLTSMEQHQKSFGVEDSAGRLLPNFLTVINLRPKDEQLVRKGWERVLKARLEDARFFFHADCKASSEKWLAMLENVVFLAPLGSMGDKCRRLEQLTRMLAEKVLPEYAEQAARAGLLAKMDLVSEMVKEFAELQGTMGGIYARRQGESEAVAQAIAEQYLPAGPDSPTPGSRLGALLALADKADTLVGCFGLNMTPSGANDPYALRRAALGISRIVMEHGLRLDLETLLANAQQAYGHIAWKVPAEESLAKLLDFFGQRLKAYFHGQGYPTRIVDAAVGAGFADIWALRARIEALEQFSREEEFVASVQTFKRAANIIRKQAMETEDGKMLTGQWQDELLSEPQEKALAQAWQAIAPRWEDLWAGDGYPELLGLLLEIKPLVDGLFDHVMVMCPERDLRINRLNLLKSLVDRFDKLADFPALQV